VVAQRLVRQLCDRCKTATQLSSADIDADPRFAALGFQPGDVVHEPCGCERCNGIGYRGRLGIIEILEITPVVRSLINEGADGGMIDKVAIEAGMTTMLDDGIAKCRAGSTSAAEILRVTTVR
jgi:general secretion pathway protein E